MPLRKKKGTDTKQKKNDILTPLEENTKKISLVEIGPRIQLQLLKIVEGCCKGNTRYNKYKQKNPGKSLSEIEEEEIEDEEKEEHEDSGKRRQTK